MAEKKIYTYNCAWCGKELLFNKPLDVALCGNHKKYYYAHHKSTNPKLSKNISHYFTSSDPLPKLSKPLGKGYQYPHPQITDTAQKSPYNQFQITSEGSCCTILKDHHEKLKEDPERLTTNFIKKLSHCRCKIKE
jgi:hypothetical protein